MNKTVTVNIGGMVFHIEEHAYDKLKKYLEAIRGYFTTSDGRDEIIQDIESRIAEMFTERIGSNRQVVVEADVEFMIDTMGQFQGRARSTGPGAHNLRSRRRSCRHPHARGTARSTWAGAGQTALPNGWHFRHRRAGSARRAQSASASPGSA